MSFYAVELVGRQSKSVTHIVRAIDRVDATAVIADKSRAALCGRRPTSSNSWGLIGKEVDREVEVLNVQCRRCRERASLLTAESIMSRK